MNNTYIIGLGGNEGDPPKTLEAAAARIAEIGSIECTPFFRSPALVPDGAPSEWNKPFWNAILSLNSEIAPVRLLSKLKEIESELGRGEHEKWSPRPIDLDIIDYRSASGELGPILQSKNLSLPHPEFLKRPFVLAPFAFKFPNWQIRAEEGLEAQSVLSFERATIGRVPALMGIVNITPDSFSDGGLNYSVDCALESIETMRIAGAQIVDIGAESTRPNADYISPETEWSRLSPILSGVRDLWKDKRFRPLVSVDTRHVETAISALELGVDIINDVSGLENEEMWELAAKSGAIFIAMHSLSVPASREHVLDESLDPVSEVVDWAKTLSEKWTSRGLAADRLILDPGVGFGKRPNHSWQLISRLKSLQTLGHKVLIGHSRKSFLNTISNQDFADRDLETIGVSTVAAELGADILRVHDLESHVRTFMARQAVYTYA